MPSPNERGYRYNHGQANWGEALMLLAIPLALVSGYITLTSIPTEPDMASFLLNERAGQIATVSGLAAVTFFAWGFMYSRPFRVIQDLTTRVQKF